MLIPFDSTPVPAATEQEARLLSCIAIESICGNNECLRKAQALGVSEDTFYKPLHQMVWQACLGLTDAGYPADELGIHCWLRDNSEGEQTPTLQEITALVDSCETTTWFNHWLEVTLDAQSKRQYRQLGMKIAELASEGASADEMSVAMEMKPKSVLAATGSVDKAVVAKEATQRIINLNNSKSGLLGLSTGIDTIDNILGGIRPHTLNVMAGRPGRGKSTLSLQIALNLATINKRVRFWSLEMSPVQIHNKLALNLAGINYQLAKDGCLTQQQLQNYENASNAIVNMPIDISEESVVTVAQIAGQLHRDIALNPKDSQPELVIVDYLQLLTPSDKRVVREQQIAQMTRDLKGITKITGIPILLLAQLSRECEKEKREPKMSDLREGGSAEQDADTITFLHWIEGMDPLELKVIVAKNREDQEGKGIVTFNKPLQRIYDKQY